MISRVHLAVVTQAQVICLICTLKARGPQAQGWSYDSFPSLLTCNFGEYKYGINKQTSIVVQ